MTISGMTGFARQEGRAEAWTWAVEARSVNGRNLDIRFRGPAAFDNLERLTREAAQARFQRGQIGVSLQAKRAEATGQAKINLEALERFLTLCEPFVASGRAAPPAMDGLLALRGVIEVADEEDAPDVHAAVERAMAQSIASALEALEASRRVEGAAVATLLTSFLDRLDELIVAAEAEAAGQPIAIKQRFERRLIELAGEAATTERIVQEAASMAVKADVREELDRLAAHVVAARALMPDKAAAGRRFDFLTQEFMREANTLCSKSATPGLTAVGLDLKAVIDQIREQAQNVE